MSNSIGFFHVRTVPQPKGCWLDQIASAQPHKILPEAKFYQYGEHPEVMIFQKVYCQADYKFPATYPGIKILDICDPDWLEDMPIRETIEAMDAITVPTQPLKEFIEQMTDKPVRLIKDRFDLEEFPKKPKTHLKKAKEVVWFGYSHNTKKLKGAVNALIDLNLKLTVFSNKDPNFMNWAECIKYNPDNYKFLAYNASEIYYELSKFDIAILPDGGEPKDRFKSENKEIIANLCGLPVVKTREELEAMLDPKARNKEAQKKYEYARENYNCIISVAEYKELIDEIKSHRAKAKS